MCFVGPKFVDTPKSSRIGIAANPFVKQTSPVLEKQNHNPTRQAKQNI